MAAFFFMSIPARPRSVVYVDGFNLYYGALRGSANRWLDLERYFTLLRQQDDIRRIRFFTARTSSPASASQAVYLRALATLPRVDIIEGKFKESGVRCRIAACTYPGNRILRTPIEKRTDVNIALQMLDDAYQDVCDTLILVSGDSDLVPAVEMVRSRFPMKETVVYVPTRNASRGAAVELRTSAHRHRSLPLELLRKAQFPANVPDGRGGTITKPLGW